MLSQGGEGAVFQLPLQPHLVFKSYRSQVERGDLDSLVSWPKTLAHADEDVVRLSSAWPTAVVSGDDGEAVGILMPRAPRRFSLRHSDGQRRLATLSYLTCDPARPAKAYGLTVPPACGVGRFGIILALARLLAAFESSSLVVSHGDLSTKNVLWSLERDPEVYVIDCDSAELHCADGDAAPPDAMPPEAVPPQAEPGRTRRRAMTPNWDDPSVEKGRNPTVATDRYSLGLIFLRVAGAANFPIQSFQRREGRVRVEFPVPSGPASRALVGANREIWHLCAKALSVEAPHERPRAAEWIEPLVEVTGALVDRGATSRFSRGAPRAPLRGLPAAASDSRATPDPRPTPEAPLAAEHVRDVSVEVTVVAQRSGARTDKPVHRLPGAMDDTADLGVTGDGNDQRVAAALRNARISRVRTWWSADATSLRYQTAAVAGAFWRWWLDAHRASLTAIRAKTLARLAALLLLDLLIVGVVVGFGAVLISPLVR